MYSRLPCSRLGTLPSASNAAAADDGRLSDAVLPDEDRVAFLFPAEDEQGPGDLLLPADQLPSVLDVHGPAIEHPGLLVRVVFTGGIVPVGVVGLVEDADELSVGDREEPPEPECRIGLLKQEQGMDDVGYFHVFGFGALHLFVGVLEQLVQLEGHFQPAGIVVRRFGVVVDEARQLFFRFGQPRRQAGQHGAEPLQRQKPLEQHLRGDIGSLVLGRDSRRLVQGQDDAGG